MVSKARDWDAFGKSAFNLFFTVSSSRNTKGNLHMDGIQRMVMKDILYSVEECNFR